MPPVAFQPHSCDQCRKLIIESNTQDTKDDAWMRRDLISDKIVFPFTFRDIKTSAEQGCKLCEWILNDEAVSRFGFESDDPDGMGNDDSSDIGTREVLSSFFDNDERAIRSSMMAAAQEAGEAANDFILIAATSPPFKSPLKYMSDVHRIDYFGLWDSNSKAIHFRTRHGLQCFAAEEDAAAKEISTRPIESDPAHCLPKVKLWFDTCQRLHTSCRHAAARLNKARLKPRRLVAIDSSGSIPKLHLQEADHLEWFPSYVALSYCWGGDQAVKTTKDTLTGLQLSIPFEPLPATLKDAITVCINLNHRYIWIDALCIVQDDEDDKLSEIAKMPYIYGRAAFTIAASRSAAAGEGFLQPRVTDPKSRAAFALSCINSTGALGTLNFVELDIQSEPIDQRGWTLQERLLSPRLIEFGELQTRWICQNDDADGVADGWREQSERDRLKPSMVTVRVALDEADGPDIGLWNHLVEIYTERKLTQITDRPLAIAGIAEWFFNLLGNKYNRYVAGLWESYIHTGLLWSVDPKDRRSCVNVYLGPSWSWISIQGPVWHEYHSTVSESQEIYKIAIDPTSPCLEHQANHFGLLSRADSTLRIKGKLAKAKIHLLKTLHPEENWVTFNDYVVEISGANDAGFCTRTADFFPDADGLEHRTAGAQDDDTLIMALEIQNSQDGPTWTSRGLMLFHRKESVDGGGHGFPTYSRLGTYMFTVDTDSGQQDDETDEEWERRIDVELDWFKHMEVTTLDLV